MRCLLESLLAGWIPSTPHTAKNVKIEWIKKGVIKPCCSEFRSPIVLAKMRQAIKAEYLDAFQNERKRIRTTGSKECSISKEKKNKRNFLRTRFVQGKFKPKFRGFFKVKYLKENERYDVGKLENIGRQNVTPTAGFKGL
ncbi:hypothetical protein QE152_g32304 [Popillia japonica]|uniref:Uncharacterized protein n=1 Tax=Popillia japonica TaxID=7064 RepID=A0AAW1IZD1_POPJA